MSTRLLTLQCECLERFLSLTCRQSEFLEYLTTEKILNSHELSAFKNEPHIIRYEAIIEKLHKSVTDCTIQMFDVNWAVLPTETAEIIVVCNYTNWTLRWPR
jgi:hypothetical protein